MLNFQAAQRWLGLRIELRGATVGFSLATIIVCANDVLQIPTGLVGLGIQWSYVFTAALNFFFQRLSESEARITSIERVHETSTLPQEAPWETGSSIQLDPAWPTKGELEFDAVCMRYRKELPLALDSVSFKLRPGMRCGVVGRTGSGQIAHSLSRCYPLNSLYVLMFCLHHCSPSILPQARQVSRPRSFGLPRMNPAKFCWMALT
jgi:ABC-type multidrug transport system fused ATPase/permease subunit